MTKLNGIPIICMETINHKNIYREDIQGKSYLIESKRNIVLEGIFILPAAPIYIIQSHLLNYSRCICKGNMEYARAIYIGECVCQIKYNEELSFLIYRCILLELKMDADKTIALFQEEVVS